MTGKLQRITSCLWFHNQAEEAASFYTSIFDHSAILQVTRFGKERHPTEGMTEGMVMSVKFQLDGQQFLALNGGPAFNFNESISLMVQCESQEEVDYYWDKLSEGGDEKAQVCGWLKDRFGVSWQVVPVQLVELLNEPDQERSERVTKAMLQMKKIDIRKLLQAFEGNKAQ